MSSVFGKSPRQRDEKDHEDHVCQKVIDQTARRAPDEMKDMPTLAKIVPFLWYAKEAEQAALMGFRSVLQVAVRLKKNRPR